jgi:N-methylhydantoinase B
MAGSLHGGGEGSDNYIRIVRHDGTDERCNTCTGVTLQPDDVIRVITATGGGFGAPRERSRGKGLEDLKNVFITIEQSREVYDLKR